MPTTSTVFCFFVSFIMTTPTITICFRGVLDFEKLPVESRVNGLMQKNPNSDTELVISS